MTTVNHVAPEGAARPGQTPAGERDGFLARLGLRFTNWAERWFPDAYVFVALAVTAGIASAGIASLDKGAAVLINASSHSDPNDNTAI